MLAANRLLIALSCIAYFSGAPANEQRIIKVGQNTFRAVLVKPEKTTLHWKDAQQQPYRYFSRLKKALEKQGKTPTILMNAGIYSSNNTPAGLHIEAGKVLKELNTKRGAGNFHLQPNGVFLITKKNKAEILTTTAYHKFYQNKQQLIRLATQSGPMLVIDGKINYRFKPNSQSHYTRNGVCITAAKQLYFIAGNDAVNLYTFAKAAQQLGCHNALYLDGSISKLYQAQHDTLFHLRSFVGILAVENEQ